MVRYYLFFIIRYNNFWPHYAIFSEICNGFLLAWYSTLNLSFMEVNVIIISYGNKVNHFQYISKHLKVD